MNTEPRRSWRAAAIVVVPVLILLVGVLVMSRNRQMLGLSGRKATPTAEQVSTASTAKLGATAAAQPAAGKVTAPAQTAAAGVTSTATPATAASPAPAKAASGTAGPSLTPIVVTPRPQPRDVFAAATLAVQATADAQKNGTPTATPPNMITATATPKPLVITSTPSPANAATAQVQALIATAQAFTTGTPAPLPAWAVTATVAPTATPKPTGTPAPTATPTATVTNTPVWIPLPTLPPARTPSPTPRFPAALGSRILFRSNMGSDGKTRTYVMNPDGSGMGQLTADWPYLIAEARDAFSADRSQRAFALRDAMGQIQIFTADAPNGQPAQTTWFGAGIAWAPAWSPAGDRIAFVSNESKNDEIWVVDRGSWPATQLTKNTWEWDKHPSWSPDGRQIIFSSNRSGRQQIWLMNADGSDPRPLTGPGYDAWDPIWVKFVD